MAYELALDGYQGPLEKLLELIEGEELAITSVSLAQVTGDFLAYVERLKVDALPEEYPTMLADFLVVASKLLLIKSKELIPSLELTKEEETDIKDLEVRLKLYQELKQTQVHLKSGWNVAPLMFGRDFLMSAEPLFYPPKTVSGDDLSRAVSSLVLQLAKIVHPQGKVSAEIVSLKMKIEEVTERLTRAAKIVFSELGGKSRTELVVLFLAVLHLVRQQLADVDQDGQFGDLTIAKRTEPRYHVPETVS